MTKPAFVTNRRRVAWAALFGVGAPPIIFTVGALLWEVVSNTLSRPADLLEEATFLLAIGLAFSAAIFGVLATPAWLLLHRNKARWPLAMTCGGVVGFAAPIVFLVMTGVSGSFDLLVINIERAWTVIVAGAAIGAVTALGMWLIAYRPPPTPQAIAEAFG